MYKASIILLLSLICYAGEKKVDDGDKASSPISDLLTKYEDVEEIKSNIQKGVKATETGVKVGKSIKDGEAFDNLRSNMKSKWKDLVFKYKHAKPGFLNYLNITQKEISKVINKLQKRVNKWRTTLPTLQAYQKAATQYVNNVLQDFGVGKPDRGEGGFHFGDIDRRWSKDMEADVKRSIRCFYNFGGWIQRRYYDVNSEAEKENDMSRYAHLLYKDNDIIDGVAKSAQERLAYITVLTNENRHRRLPRVELMNSAEALKMINKILERSYGLNEKGEIKQEAMLDTVRKELTDNRKTYRDVMELGTYIKKKRVSVAVQKAELERLLTNATMKFERLKLREKEKTAYAIDNFIGNTKCLYEDKELRGYERRRKELLSGT